MYQILPIEFATPAYDESVRLRDKILRQPLGLQFTPQELAKEYEHIHLACYDTASQLLGCLVLVPLDKQRIKMRQVAVDEPFQKAGIGSKLVAASEVWAKQAGYQQMELHARDTAIPFYLKHQYETTGKPFVEVNISHYKMCKQL